MKKQKWSFGALYEPQRSQKKRYEQLRSRSIDWRCRMVRTGSQKYEKAQYVFVFWGLKCRRVIVNSVIFYVYVSREVPKARFRSFKIDLCSKFDQKWAFWHLWFFLFLVFSTVSFFTFLTITQICPIWFQYRGQDYETQVAVSFSWPKYWNRWNFWFRISHMICREWHHRRAW